MPPKAAAASKPSKKTEAKKKDKIIEDKTFGLKNKKGAKQQKFIQQVEKQVKFGGNASARKVADATKVGDKKKEEDPLSFNSIFKPVTPAQKVEQGADPKSVLCAFFKQGQCTKGDKCKFSHDLTIERKAEKRSIYCDMRDDEDQKLDTMDQWDDAKLKEVIEQKHGEADQSKPKTDIICKFFLDAVEKSKYGWFWECPNGLDCHYRHALPSGFVLKKDKIKEKKDEISLEDLIETERNSLGSNLTKVTLSSFIAWKKRKLIEKKQTIQKEEDKKRADFKAGRQVGISGREMFTFNPDMANQEDLEDGDDTFDHTGLPTEDDEDNINYKEIGFDGWDEELTDVDGTGTQASVEDRLQRIKLLEDGAAGPIDEDLFDVEDDEALAEIDEDSGEDEEEEVD